MRRKEKMGGSLGSAPLRIPGGGVVGNGDQTPGLPSSAQPKPEPGTEAVELPAFKGSVQTTG